MARSYLRESRGAEFRTASVRAWSRSSGLPYEGRKREAQSRTHESRKCEAQSRTHESGKCEAQFIQI